MPSVEIVCIGQSDPSECDDYPFAVETDRNLVSHRSPHPRFQSDFDALSGAIYHLGNPDLRAGSGGPFFAYELLSEACRHREPPSALEFAAEFVGPIFSLLDALVSASPQSEILFTTDWQFGPDHAVRLEPLSLSAFRRAHDAGEVPLNSAVRVHAG
jgi:hypothetical protein